ncbi:NAD-binding protein [Streptomyces sp. NPDC021212]|uniref:NAD-binding protein n=1 Tax=Streptomyces sp. NPDC021212 TaxID=3365118 RepID=UPI003795557B
MRTSCGPSATKNWSTQPTRKITMSMRNTGRRPNRTAVTASPGPAADTSRISFAMVLACKDLGLAVDLGRDLGVPTELSAVVEQIFRRSRTEHGDLAGEMSPVRLYEALAGQEFRLSGPATAPARAPLPV